MDSSAEGLRRGPSSATRGRVFYNEKLHSSAELEFAEQRNANASALGHFDTFRSHRAALTERACQAAMGRTAPRLCVLGAGNCYDLDLEKVASVYSEVHLVDIDWRALKGAYARADRATRSRIHCHAPVELSGILNQLERWRMLDVTAEEALACPDSASQQIAENLPGPFDVVVSACILTQIQLAVVRVLPDTHPLFEAARHTTSLIHLRTLRELLAPGGRAILATDVTSDAICPRNRLESAPDLGALLAELQQSGELFYAVQPERLSVICADDPLLRRGLRLNTIKAPWLWQNGPERVFLVYALELDRI